MTVYPGRGPEISGMKERVEFVRIRAIRDKKRPRRAADCFQGLPGEVFGPGVWYQERLLAQQRVEAGITCC